MDEKNSFDATGHIILQQQSNTKPDMFINDIRYKPRSTVDGVNHYDQIRFYPNTTVVIWHNLTKWITITLIKGLKNDPYLSSLDNNNNNDNHSYLLRRFRQPSQSVRRVKFYSFIYSNKYNSVSFI